jgi:GTP:adenosylcobinamide-phosphate guanylyltransferase
LFASDETISVPHLPTAKDHPLPGVTLIFPMAGRGERFGTTFKPFLPIENGTFIEAAVAPFRKWRSAISRILFVYLREQEESRAVRASLESMFVGLPWEAVILEHPTAGPAETFTEAVERAGVVGPIIACDCDHAVNVDPLFEAIAVGAAGNCLLPVWDLAGEEIKSWSVAGLGPDGRVTAIAEKQVPEGADRVAGVIGCYYFADAQRVAAACRQARYVVISQVISQWIGEGAQVRAVPIGEARFFGDPARLAKAVGDPTAANSTRS